LEDVSQPARLSRETALGSGLVVCCCFPIRSGVMIAAGITWLVLVIVTIDRARGNHFDGFFRHVAGGYARYGHLANGIIDAIGILFSLAGFMGCYFIQKSMVKAYFRWQVVRVIVWFAVGVNSLLLLMDCESWVNSVDEMKGRYEWNEAMFQTALSGNCAAERKSFYITTLIALVLFIYITYMTQRFLEMIDLYPKYLLQLDKDLGPNAFVSISKNERTPFTSQAMPSYTLPRQANAPLAMYNKPGTIGMPSVAVPSFGRRW